MITALLTLVVLFAPPQEEPILPPATKLVEEALTAYRKADMKADLFTMPMLVESLVEVGREEEARRLVLDVEDEILRSLMLALYVGDVTKRKKMTPDLDALLANEPEEARSSIYFSLVEKLAKQGRLADAETFFNRLSDERGTRVMKVHASIPLIDAFLAAGDRKGARRIVRAALKIGSGFVLQLATSEQFTPLAAAAVELDEFEALHVLLDEAQIAAENYPGLKLSVIVLSRVGRWRAATEDRTGAERAFDAARRIARQLAEDAHEEQDESQRELGLDDARKAYVALAATECVAGFPKRADKSLDAFLRLMKDVEPASADYKFFDAMETCLEVGDREGANRLIAEIDDPYWRAKARLDAASILLDAGAEEHARERLAEAATEFERAGDKINTEGETNRISLLLDMSVLHARLGDETAAANLGRRASELAGNEAGHLQQIARSHVRAGLLAEAYETLRRMPEGNQYRLLPLLELAVAAARREAERAAE